MEKCTLIALATSFHAAVMSVQFVILFKTAAMLLTYYLCRRTHDSVYLLAFACVFHVASHYQSNRIGACIMELREI